MGVALTLYTDRQREREIHRQSRQDVYIITSRFWPPYAPVFLDLSVQNKGLRAPYPPSLTSLCKKEKNFFLARDSNSRSLDL